jgi:hypothetical protein
MHISLENTPGTVEHFSTCLCLNIFLVADAFFEKKDLPLIEKF